jgi:membrane-bound lytic murein transglycosylase D
MRILVYFLTLVVTGAMAQRPEVPRQMVVGGITLTIDEPARREIQESVDALTANPKYFNVHVQRARSYFPIIERVFKEERVPDDFKYLVLQESALLPDAVSTSDAVGFWQFKDFTALEMGLRVDKTVDERMNIVSSSRAAARYLKKNNERFFDNWIITLMAYQMGAGAAIKAGGEKYKGDKSMTIDRRTYWYIKKFLAHKIAFEEYINGPANLTFVEVNNAAGKSLEEVARESGILAVDVTDYNKWLRRGKIPDDREYTVLLPVTQEIQPIVTASDKKTATKKPVTSAITKTTAARNINSSYDLADPDEFPQFENRREAQTGEMTTINDRTAVIARKNDRVATLAGRGGISISRFLSYNDMDANDRIQEGKIYYLKKKKSKPAAHYHAVQKGEDLWTISQKYGMRLAKLKQRNRIRKEDVQVGEGRILWLRYIRPRDTPVEYAREPIEEVSPVVTKKADPVTEKKAQPLPAEKKVTEVVNETSSVEKREWNSTPSVSTSDARNSEDEEDEIRADEMTSGSRISHKVQAGETFYSISKKYEVKVQDLLRWNSMEINDPLAVGQMLIILKPATLPIAGEKPQTEVKENVYVVQNGDTLYGISRKFNISVSELKKLNNKETDTIKPGEKLKVGK